MSATPTDNRAPGLNPGRCWLLGLIGLALSLTPARGQGLDGREDFGRWQIRPSQCLLRRAPAGSSSRARPRGCRSVRLDQQLSGLLSLRLSEQSSADQLGSTQLTLAGVLAPGSRAMDCREGRCKPHWPLVLQVSALAERGLRGEPEFSQLPQARLARGDCRLDAEGLRCQVEDSEELQWQVEARW